MFLVDHYGIICGWWWLC